MVLGKKAAFTIVKCNYKNVKLLNILENAFLKCIKKYERIVKILQKKLNFSNA